MRSVQRLTQFLGRVAAEGSNADVADPALFVEHEVPVVVGLAVIAQHGFHVDLSRVRVNFSRLVLPGMNHGHRDQRAFRPFHPADGVVESMPSVLLPSISTMRSPARMPAR